MRDVVIGHGEDGDLGDGPRPPNHPPGPLVDGGQIGVHVPGVPAAPGHFLTGGGHLWQVKKQPLGDQISGDLGLLGIVGENECDLNNIM